MDDPLSEDLLCRPGCILGHKVIVKQETYSTNDDAHELGRTTAPFGTVVTAEFQTKGRGRLSRSWHSPAGKNLLFSVLLSVDAARQGPGLLTLAAGIAVARALLARGVDSAIKWPNDVRTRGCKLAGILCEATEKYLVAGIGINVNQTAEEMPAELAATATSLFMETGKNWDRPALFKDVLALLEQELIKIEQGRQNKVLETWMEFSEVSGKRVRAHTPGGVIEGLACGVRPDGALLIRTGNGEQAVMAGDVEVLGKADDASIPESRG